MIHSESILGRSGRTSAVLTARQHCRPLKVRMSRFPKWGETVSILTFPRGVRKIVAYRDFVLSDAEGREIGHATSEWMLIDLASRKVVAIPEGVFDAIPCHWH